MNTNKLNKFWDTTLKIIIAIFSLLIAIFFVFGLIGRAIETVFKNQQKQVDKMMSNLVISKQCKNAKDFKRIATFKSKVYFFKTSIAPIIILFLSLLTFLIFGSIVGFSNGLVWNYETASGETGIATLFYIFDFSNLKYAPPFGFTIIDETKSLFLNTPHFSVEAIGSYITVSLLLVGGIWYLINISAYIARTIRINKLSKTIYSQNLDEIDLAKLLNSQNLKIIPDETKNNQENIF